MRQCSALANASCSIQVSNMAELMLNADFAIGAGGAATWERCAVGLPSIIIAVAENQLAVAKEVARRGAVYFAGELRQIDPLSLKAMLDDQLQATEALAAMSQCARRLVDAKGAARVAQQLLRC